MRDLRIYAEYLDEQYITNGSYWLIEIKLGGDELIEEGAETLKELASIIDTKKMKEPAFMVVLCAIAPFAYMRKDGVYVVPITNLKP